MMIKPGISDLSKKEDSRYTLVTMAAKRARLIGENSNEPGNNCIKPVSRAVQEIADGKIQYCRGEESLESLYGEASLYANAEPSSDLNLEALKYELEKKALEEKRDRERMEREAAENGENA